MSQIQQTFLHTNVSTGRPPDPPLRLFVALIIIPAVTDSPKYSNNIIQHSSFPALPSAIANNAQLVSSPHPPRHRQVRPPPTPPSRMSNANANQRFSPFLFWTDFPLINLNGLGHRHLATAQSSLTRSSLHQVYMESVLVIKQAEHMRTKYPVTYNEWTLRLPSDYFVTRLSRGNSTHPEYFLAESRFDIYSLLNDASKFHRT
ncbi:hypothetical protein R3P38DRAFT_3612451 [Favolaschia claudopus]|uniref:Uncharacterized protein n=1 Tax=Favolaschia claudopus TaxID=2862362 RepID=A0AAW0A6P8_9AGAR